MRIGNHQPLLSFLGVLALVAAASPPVVAQEARPDWKAGTASVAITPTQATWMAGYASRKKPSEGKAQDLFAKALALEDAAGARLVIVTLDLVGIPRTLRDAVAKQVQEKHRLPPASLLLNASHTHCGPVVRSGGSVLYEMEPEQTRRIEQYGVALREKLVALVGKALADLQPARLGYSRARAGFAMNRRLPTAKGYQNSPYPDGPVDHTVPVLRVEGADGKLRAILFGYACHNTTLSFYQFCGDYAGYAQEYLEQAHPGATALFVAGCGGDQNPYPRGTLELAKQHGRALANAVEAALLPRPRPVRGPLKAIWQEVTLQLVPPSGRDALLELKQSTNPFDQKKAKLLLDELEKTGRIKATYTYPIQVVQFGGDLTLIALAGEVVVDYALRLQRELAGQPLWVAAYSNDVFGYVPSVRVLKEGGYEGGGAMRYSRLPGPFAPSVEERIVTAVHQLVRKVRAAAPAAAQPRAEQVKPTLVPPVRTVDLNVGEGQEVELADGKKVRIKLLDLRETRDDMRQAVRRAEVTVEVAGRKVELVSANYRLPVTVGGVQIDCPITKGYRQNSTQGVAGSNPWGLDKDARVRLWPAGSPLVNPGTFIYPAKQRWFASGTQMANEPVHVDGGENPLAKRIYYHYGLDIGGAETLVEVIAATDGVVISSSKAVLPGYADSPVKPRYDVVYLLDGRGWYYRYSHLHIISPDVRPGRKVKMGQLLGLLGKEGASGGWSHLHFDISARQPSGKWGIVEGYAFLWEAYLAKYRPKLLAVARPHHFAAIGDEVELDGTRSWSAAGKIRSYAWTFADGKTATGATVRRTYKRPGVYSEVLQVTDAAGEVDYDFAVVNVVDRQNPGKLPPSIHAAYAPTFGIQPGHPVTFLVRTFRTTDGKETWDFGDGSPKVVVQSDGNVVPLAKDGYARTVHRYARPGHYLVRVERTNQRGETAVAYLQVRVGRD